MAGIAVVVGEETRNYLLELWVEIVKVEYPTA